MQMEETQKELVRLVTAGSVDDGKSTLIGRLLYDCNAVYQDQLEALRARGGVQGEEIDYSLITDGLAAEREQGITIDVAYRYFSTPKRRFIIADVPGHEQYTRNMVTGASNANIALLLADASQGVSIQTRRHLFLASLLRIPHIVVVVNKMDMVEYQQESFERIKTEIAEYAAKLPVRDLQFIPISALRGEMIVKRGECMPWYQGRTLYDYLENLQITSDRNLIDTRFPVQCVIRTTDQSRRYGGTLEGGILRVGDEVKIIPSYVKTKVSGLYVGDQEVAEAYSPQSIAVSLADDVDLSRGDMVVRPNNIPQTGTCFDAQVCWFDQEPGVVERSYLLKQTTRTVRCELASITYRLAIDTLHRESTKMFSFNDIGRVSIQTTEPLYFDPYGKNRNTGSFILIDELTKNTVATGMILQKSAEADSDSPSVAAKVHGPVLWFTGLSGSGKSTIAEQVAAYLSKKGIDYEWLDGDRFREIFHNDLGFTREDRIKNIERAGAVANLLARHGVFVLATFITPYKEQREWLRKHVTGYTEVFVDAPVTICQERDVKGLYQKAQRGEVMSMTGVSDPFEVPDTWDLHLDTDGRTVEECVDEVFQYLKERSLC